MPSIMITHHNPLQNQQIGTFHLVLAIFLAFLTVYPYIFHHNHKCCSVSAYSGDDLNLKHQYIEKFDIIEANELGMERFDKRNTDTQQVADSDQQVNENELKAILSPGQKVKKVQFSSLGRKFNLILNKPTHLISDDFSVVTLDADSNPTAVPFSRDTLSVLEGYLESEPNNSRATVALNVLDKLMTAQIQSGQDLFVVEPTYMHKESLFLSDQPSHVRSPNGLPNNSTIDSKEQQDTSRTTLGTNLKDDNGISKKVLQNTMIVYNLRDHKQFQYDSPSTNKGDTLFQPETLCASVNISDLEFSQANNHKEPQKPFNPELEDVLKYWVPSSMALKRNGRINKRGIEYLTEHYRERTRCTLHLVADYLFYKYVGKNDLQTTINYLLALVDRVNRIYLPTVWDTGEEGGSEQFKNIGFTVQNITIHQAYTRSSYDDKHYNMQTDQLWPAREFLDDFSKHSPPKHYCLAHLLTYRKFDSPVLGLAYVASARHGTIGGICSPTQQRDNTLYKHNTGISTSRGINGETLITRQADLVVAHELGHNLGAEHDSNECRPSASRGGAYLMHPFAVMGFESNNRFLSNCSRLAIGRVLRRKASTCFVGVIDHVCGNGIIEDDEECDGGGIGLGHNDPCCDDSCRLTPGSQCSDRHHLCCNKCQLVPAGVQCRQAEDYNCKQASICDGTEKDCPKPPSAEDNQVCLGRGLCRSGECRTYCEIKGLHSCLCKTPSTACKLCCKTSENGTDCRPVDDKDPPLPDGVLCYRGVCEKGRCEQPIQDVVERLWLVIEHINLNTFVKFLRDNIILVVIIVSIPIWCIVAHYINEFDKRIKNDIMNAMMRHGNRRKSLPSQSPFLPRLFVGDDTNNSTSTDDVQSSKNSMKPSFKQEASFPGLSTNGTSYPPPHRNPLSYGFKLPAGEEVVYEPSSSIALNNIDMQETSKQQEVVGQGNTTHVDDDDHDDEDPETINSYSTQV